MVTALQDLSNRIASNTLTGPQQAALTTALAVLIPVFPFPDELSDSIPQTEEALAREWIAPLYTLQAEAGAGGSVVLATTVIAWFINPLTGSDTNNGTSPSTPLKTFAALGALWRGTAGGGRPVLAPATGTTVTVTLQADAPVTDPMAPILDVDITAGASLIIVGAAKTAAHNGTIATANAFARTVANGQVRITDATVPNFGVFPGVASLLVDNTATGVFWIYGPDPGPSATGTTTVGYQPVTAGVASIPTQTNIAAGHLYSIFDTMHASLGEGFVTRSFPSLGPASQADASVFLYRLHLQQPGTNPTAHIDSPTVQYIFQECQYDHPFVEASQVSFVNCFGFHNLGHTIAAGGFTELLAGGLSGQVSGTVTSQPAGTVFCDLDFALVSNTPYICGPNAAMQLGNASRWGTGIALACTGGTLIVAPAFEATGIAYGTDSGGNFGQIFSTAGDAGTILYGNDGSGTPAENAFVFTDTAFAMGVLGASSFGNSNATGLSVGPTTNTLAHLDAALGAGTGFGGAAIDPRSGSTFRILA